MHVCVFIYIQNNYTVHIYYVNTNFYFGCDSSFDSPSFYCKKYWLQCKKLENKVQKALKLSKIALDVKGTEELMKLTVN